MEGSLRCRLLNDTLSDSILLARDYFADKNKKGKAKK